MLKYSSGISGGLIPCRPGFVCFVRSLMCSPKLFNQSLPLGVDKSIENNLKTETNRLAKTGIRFWEKVSLNDKVTSGKYTLQIDSKNIRTPLGNPLAVDKERKLLALMLKMEWETLPSLSIKQFSLPLTSLTSRCIDMTAANDKRDSEMIEKIGGNREVINQDLLRFLDTDTILVFSPSAEFEGALRKAQDEMYLPIIKSIEEFLSSRYKTSTALKLKILDADIHGLRSNIQSKEVKTAALAYLNSLSPWNLAVFEKVVLTTKSFICGILLIENKAFVNKVETLQYSVDDIVTAASLEIIHQTERWGEVEDTHDVGKRDICRNVNAASIIAYKN